VALCHARQRRLSRGVRLTPRTRTAYSTVSQLLSRLSRRRRKFDTPRLCTCRYTVAGHAAGVTCLFKAWVVWGGLDRPDSYVVNGEPPYSSATILSKTRQRRLRSACRKSERSEEEVAPLLLFVVGVRLYLASLFEEDIPLVKDCLEFLDRFLGGLTARLRFQDVLVARSFAAGRLLPQEFLEFFRFLVREVASRVGYVLCFGRAVSGFGFSVHTWSTRWGFPPVAPCIHIE